MNLTRPLKAQPGDVVFDGINVFLAFFFWVGVVKAQVACATKLLGHTKIKTDRLSVPNMQVTVWLRRKAGHDGRHSPSGKVFLNDFCDEIIGRARCRISHNCPYMCSIVQKNCFYCLYSCNQNAVGHVRPLKRRYYTRSNPLRDTRTTNFRG